MLRIVEQSHILKSGFDPKVIHNPDNIIAVDRNVHVHISAYYSSIQPYTEGQRVRDWLAGQPLNVQYEFGVQKLIDFGAIK